MPSFKPKGSKAIKVCEKQSTTLDGKHRAVIDALRIQENETIPRLKRSRMRLKKLRKKCKTVERRLDLDDRIYRLKCEIQQASRARVTYWQNNSKSVFDYYEKKTSTPHRPRVLGCFFGLDGVTEDKQRGATDVRKYLSSLDQSFIDLDDFVVATDKCTSCGTGEMISVEHEGVLVCNECSCGVSFLIENEKPSYKEPPKEVCFYAYKRINHFREILAQFQAKETTQIPDVVISTIKFQIKKERITAKHLTNKRAKELLKKLGYNKYYEHIPFIKDKLGIRPPVMTPSLEERLCNLFMEIQGPYARFCPAERVNFLNYYYTVYKLCELLDQTQFLPYFPMLKDREKRIEQDDIWKKICKELAWEFIPTV